MTPCPTCARHLFSADSTCPFCAARVSQGRRVFNAVGGAVTALVLAACYGSPPKMDTSDTGPMDFDADGYTDDVDCDDTDAAVHPDAVEVCDDTIDNNCDTLTDTADEACAR
jgi:hypothetical protein